MGERTTLTASKEGRILSEIERTPDLIESVIDNQAPIIKIAKRLAPYPGCFVIGRGFFNPVAMEGALKIKEVSYIHAEGYHSAELKHGPLALLGDAMPVIALLHPRAQHKKMLSSIHECSSRNSPVFGIISAGDSEGRALLEEAIEIPTAPPSTAAIVTATVLQLIAYHIAEIRGCPIDQPRHLAKSVTVE